MSDSVGVRMVFLICGSNRVVSRGRGAATRALLVLALLAAINARGWAYARQTAPNDKNRVELRFSGGDTGQHVRHWGQLRPTHLISLSSRVVRPLSDRTL